jgi:hypothetical protein
MLSSYGDANIRAKISTATYVSVDDEIIPQNELIFYPNYPNPFNPRTNFSFWLEDNNRVKLEVCDIKGRVINTILDKNLSYGKHIIPWNGKSYSSGVYFVRLETKSSQIIQKIILLK